MKVCIDARPISPRMHGIGRYTLNLITQLALISQSHDYLLLTNPNTSQLLPPLPTNFKLCEFGTPNYSIQEQVVVPWILRKESADLFHSTTYSAPIYSPCKMVVTIHDLTPMVLPNLYGWKHRLYYGQIVRRSLGRADQILTVSHSSKHDIVRIFGLDPKRIAVTYNGVEDHFQPGRVVESKDPVILSVVNPKPHKNLGVILKAFEKLHSKGLTKYRLVLVGADKPQVLEKVNKVVAGCIHCLSDVTDDELVSLYQKADVFVHPSLYEGFCLPVLEAMACGTPVITSNVASLPELTDNAAIFINPNKIDDLAEAIYNVLANEELRKNLRERGLKRAKQFSWQEMARQTLKLYEEVGSLTG